MASVRRWYIYLVSAISLQAVTWALIALLRNLSLPRLHPPPETDTGVVEPKGTELLDV